MTDDVDRERRYEAVLKAIEHNSGDPQPPGALPRSVYQALAKPYGSYSREAIEYAIRAAVDAGDVIVWRDREQRIRLTRTLDEDLPELIATENAKEYPATDLIEQASRHIDDRVADDD